MLVEGEKLMREAIQSGLAPSDALIDVEKAGQYEPLAGFLREAGARVFLTTGGMIASVCDTKTPQGACGAFRMPRPFDEADAPARLVVLDGVQDPGNVGTIWRTADAAGLNGILMSRACADPFSPKTQRAAMGSGFRVPVCVKDDLPAMISALQERGVKVIASTLRGEPFYSAPKGMGRFALVIGNEARGVSQAILDMADYRLTLPMRGGAESLNAAVAAGIMMYELTRD